MKEESTGVPRERAAAIRTPKRLRVRWTDNRPICALFCDGVDKHRRTDYNFGRISQRL